MKIGIIGLQGDVSEHVDAMKKALKVGDSVLAYFEVAGRHFGQKVEETIREK